jgi:hypothetical protein
MRDTGVFTGADMVAGIYVPSLKKFEMFGEISTFTYSMHREVTPVRSLGLINPKGYVRGARTIAGSLVFTVFDRHMMHEIKVELRKEYARMMVERGFTKKRIQQLNDLDLVTDEIPPFDIVVTMANEGNAASSSLIITGVRIVNEGQIMSVQDLIIENQMQYVATGIQLMEAEV